MYGGTTTDQSVSPSPAAHGSKALPVREETKETPSLSPKQLLCRTDAGLLIVSFWRVTPSLSAPTPRDSRWLVISHTPSDDDDVVNKCRQSPFISHTSRTNGRERTRDRLSDPHTDILPIYTPLLLSYYFTRAFPMHKNTFSCILLLFRWRNAGRILTHGEY